MSQNNDIEPKQEITSPAEPTEATEAAEGTDAVEDTTKEASAPEADEAQPVKTPEAAPAEVEAKAEPEAEAKAETETKAEPEAEVKVEAEAEAKTEAKAETEAKPEAEAKPETKATKPEAEGKAKDAKATDPALDERHQAALAPIAEAFEKKTPVKGKVIGWNKGGFHVALGSIAAFCPVSQIEAGNPRSPKRYVDRSFDFMVFEIEKGGRRVVVSRSAALKVERDARAAKVRKTFKVGDKIEGKVSSLTDFGAFVTIDDGIEGLVHVSEISRQRVEHPKERLKVGQDVQVQVLKIEKGGNRVSLSMKKLEKDPWKSIADRFPAGGEFTGTVKRKADFGLFVEVEPGIEGLVHTSRLPLGDTMDNEAYSEGKTVGGWVQDVEPKRRRLALSLREVPNPEAWNQAEDNFPIGSIVKGQVERVAKFGAFIMLAPGLTGLLPFSELNQGANVNLKRQYHPGKEVSVRVMSIDRGKRRISLGTESSKAVGTSADYKDFQARQKKADAAAPMGALAAAFAKITNN